MISLVIQNSLHVKCNFTLFKEVVFQTAARKHENNLST